MKPKIEEKTKARALYQEGRTYNEIVKLLGVSKGSVSLWCNDLAKPKIAAKIAESAAIRATRPKPEPRPIKPRIGVAGEGPYSDYTIYKSSDADGVARIQLVHRETHERLLMSMARYRMSVHKGRKLRKSEIVAHRIGKNDDIDNLFITTRVKIGLARRSVKEKQCVMCEETFVPKRAKVETCSKECRYTLVGAILTGRKYN